MTLTKCLSCSGYLVSQTQVLRVSLTRIDCNLSLCIIYPPLYSFRMTYDAIVTQGVYA